MTPKDKAEQLVDLYYPLFTHGMATFDAKQCALIAVDEVINSMTVATSVHLPYWQQVKHEINKL